MKIKTTIAEYLSLLTGSFYFRNSCFFTCLDFINNFFTVLEDLYITKANMQIIVKTLKNKVHKLDYEAETTVSASW